MPRWEYCLVDLDTEPPACYLQTTAGPERMDGRAADVPVESESDSPPNAGAVIALLSEDGWELAASTLDIAGERSIVFGRLRGVAAKRTLFFKRLKQSI